MPGVSTESSVKPLEMTVQEAESFVKRISFPDGMLGCWWWKGPADKDGYGRFSHRGKRVPAHVVAYKRLKGHYDPSLQVAHLCHIRLCVNPGHLEAQTKDENLGKGARRRPAMTPAERQRKRRSKAKQRQSDLAYFRLKIAEHRFKADECGFTPTPVKEFILDSPDGLGYDYQPVEY